MYFLTAFTLAFIAVTADSAQLFPMASVNVFSVADCDSMGINGDGVTVGFVFDSSCTTPCLVPEDYGNATLSVELIQQKGTEANGDPHGVMMQCTFWAGSACSGLSQTVSITNNTADKYNNVGSGCTAINPSLQPNLVSFTCTMLELCVNPSRPTP
jgi:hypothetical protein